MEEMNEYKIQRMASFFKTIGEPTRLRILFALGSCERPVQDIANELKLPQSTVSHQLRILRQEQFVIGRRSGKRVFYSIYDSHVHLILAQGVDHVTHTDDEHRKLLTD